MLIPDVNLHNKNILLQEQLDLSVSILYRSFCVPQNWSPSSVWITEEVFVVADMTRTEASELQNVPMIRVVFRKDDPFVCEDVTGEVSGYLGQENVSSQLYRLTIEK